ncbi:MAG: M20/M25/M40 family metallo-hydrolase [Acidobacteriota bacterium]|nr:M20/M25/M40 family metallo-hydrolase [Acidobacteriota bacterium]
MRTSLFFVFSALACAQSSVDRDLARALFKELIEINTTDSVGDNTRAAQAMAARLKSAGFPDSDIVVLGPTPRKGNLIARIHGTGGGKPILFLAHLDVVEARREDWSFDPFTFLERDGYFYGRGTQDIKDEAALYVATFMRLRREGFRPSRDLILALTSDEEGGPNNGVKWLLEAHRDLIDAAFCVNGDAGGVQVQGGKRLLLGIQAAEKTFYSFRLEVKNRGGHSSLPEKDNAIYRLSEALTRLSRFTFPVHLNPVTQSFFERTGALNNGPDAADFRAVAKAPPDAAAAARLSERPIYNALLRTTCIPTMLAGGHAENALPQTATVTVNCRLVPGDLPDAVQREIERVLGDPEVSVTPVRPSVPSPFSLVPRELLDLAGRVGSEVWPGLPVVPLMETGGTDGIYLRVAGIPTYGIAAAFTDLDDIRAHGKDERIAVQAFYDGLNFDYRLIRALGTDSGIK